MTAPAIVAEGLGKQYRLGPRSTAGYQTLRDTMAQAFRQPFGTAAEAERFWALRDVTLSIRPGEVMGIIGRNGSGKSTFLKILSRITTPSAGFAEIRGKVSSLLEVGTGFHPELTGRENIALSSAILGMRRSEIARKFDEIVAFAEVEKFIDTPVKHYSSGMYLRLAFAVAAHLEPDILLVDEVLAVGDAAFQKKCMGKMGEVARQGRTVLFVSHNMGAVSTLTERALWLSSGRLQMDGPSSEVIAAYLAASYKSQAEWRASGENSKPIQILSLRVASEGVSMGPAEIDVNKPVRIEVEYVVRRPLRGAVVGINIHAFDGAHLASMEDSDGDPDLLLERKPGRYRTFLTLPAHWLNSGNYLIRVGSGTPRVEVFENIEALTFTLVETGDPALRGHRKGYLLPMLKWTTTPLAPNPATVQ